VNSSHVEQGRVRRVYVESFQSLKGVASLLKLESRPGQNALECFPNRRVVIDD